MPPPRMCGITAPGELRALLDTVKAHVQTIEQTTRSYNASQQEILELRDHLADLEQKLAASTDSLQEAESVRHRMEREKRRMSLLLEGKDGLFALQVRQMLQEAAIDNNPVLPP